MDFRFFAGGNLLAILFSLATDRESQSIMDLFEYRQRDLIGYMPVKIFFPALEGQEWLSITGYDQELMNHPHHLDWLIFHEKSAVQSEQSA